MAEVMFIILGEWENACLRTKPRNQTIYRIHGKLKTGVIPEVSHASRQNYTDTSVHKFPL